MLETSSKDGRNVVARHKQQLKQPGKRKLVQELLVGSVHKDKRSNQCQGSEGDLEGLVQRPHQHDTD